VAHKVISGNIIGHGFHKNRWVRRRRFRCSTCGKTFCSSTGTPHHRLQYPRATFAEANTLSVEGLNKSAIARVKRIAWNAVHRWLQTRTWRPGFSSLLPSLRLVFEKKLLAVLWSQKWGTHHQSLEEASEEQALQGPKAIQKPQCLSFEFEDHLPGNSL
jgi:hypothetical protein